MTKRSTIIVGDECFASKEDVRRRVQEIFSRGFLEVEGSDKCFVLALFERHRSAVEKIGAGVARIRVVRVQPWGDPGFEIERIDGTFVDISYKECLTPSTPAHWFRAACRNAVSEQKFDARDRAFAEAAELRCPVTSELLTPESCHVHHDDPWPFESIVKAYIADRFIDLGAVQYVEGDRVTVTAFVDAALSRDFSEYHRARAILRVVSKRANTSILRRRSR